MKKVINFCGNCPFLYSDFNPDSAGYSTIDICQLNVFLKLNPHSISVHDNCGFNFDSKTPEWCPLKKESFSFEFEEFSTETKLEIEKVSEEIDEIENFEAECDDEYYNEQLQEQNGNRIQKLYSKLEELYKNK